MREPLDKQQLREFQVFLGRELFFVVGLPKSGTTWVQHLLNAHTDVACYGESHFFDILLPQIKQCFQHYNKEIIQQGGIVAHLKEYGGHVDSLQYKLEEIHLILLFCMQRMMMKWVNTEGDQIVIGEKTPDTIRHLHLLHSLLPQAKVIHVIRDGRDCATSGWFFNLSGITNNKAVAQSFEEYVSAFMKTWKTSITMARTIGAVMGDRYCEVKYEAMLDKPSLEVTKLFHFLEVSANDSVVQHCINSASFEKMGDGHPQGHESRSAFVRKGVRGDWKNHFSAELGRDAWEIAGDLLESLEYSAS